MTTDGRRKETRLKENTSRYREGSACAVQMGARRWAQRRLAGLAALYATMILANWAEERANFLHVCPREMLPHLKHPLSDEGVRVPAE